MIHTSIKADAKTPDLIRRDVLEDCERALRGKGGVTLVRDLAKATVVRIFENKPTT